MDSDEDYQSFSPQVEHRRLKRLRKKAIQAPSSPLLDPVNVLRSVSSVDFSEWEALENSRSKTLDSLYNDDTNESSNPMPDSVDDLLGIPRVDFGKLEAEEASGARTPDSLCGDDSNGPSNSAEDLLPITRVDFAKLEALEASVTKDLDDSNEPLLSQSSCQENEMESGFGEELDAAENSSQFGVGFGEDRRETKRTLEFDNLDQRSELKLEKPEKKRIIESPRHGENEEEENTKQKKKKRIKSESGDDLKSIRAPNKRKQEKVVICKHYYSMIYFISNPWFCIYYNFCIWLKFLLFLLMQERKAYLQQLHADSQRLLRGWLKQVLILILY